MLTGDPGFDVVLVYDVSRWGRFQNPDQSAHYEFHCTEARVRVEYCAELFENDGSLSSTILKSLKRAMAAEYSRELSVKICAARLRILKEGYWLGASPGFGLRRRIVERDGSLGAVLEHGQRKAIQGQHIILEPGPPHEVATVRRIYRMFLGADLTSTAIARVLRRAGRMQRRLRRSLKHIGRVFRQISYYLPIVLHVRKPTSSIKWSIFHSHLRNTLWVLDDVYIPSGASR